MLEKFLDIIAVIVVLSFVIPICLFFWINCVDFLIDKFKEWFY